MFLLFGLGFWIVAIIFIIAIIIATEFGRGFLSFILSACLTACIIHSYHLHPLNYIQIHPTSIPLFLLGYILIGCLWGIAKWYLYTNKRARDFRRNKSSDGLHLQVSDHKSDIITWMTYWPFSIIGSLIGDFLIHIFHHIYDEIANFLQRIADRAATKRF